MSPYAQQLESAKLLALQTLAPTLPVLSAPSALSARSAVNLFF